MECKMTDENMKEGEEGSQVQEAAPEQEQVIKPKKGKATGNLIADVAAEIENAPKSKALKELDNLAENIEANFFKMGGYLTVVSNNSWFEGYESFDAFVAEKFGFKVRKAHYLMQIYQDLVNKQIPWEKVAHLGWTKLKELAPILTLENLDEWVAKAEMLTVDQLKAAIKAKPEGEGAIKTTDDIVKLGPFKVKPDQAETITHALAKAKGEVQTEFDTVALENICSLYLSGNMGVIATSDPETTIASIGWEKTLEIFDKLFPEINITVGLPGDEEAAA
jgi:hypothetical protein